MSATRDSVTLYCRPGCAKCRHVLGWLEGLDAFDVVEVDATTDEEAQTFLIDRGFRGLPVVYTAADGRAAWGVEPDTLTAELPLLARTGSTVPPTEDVL